MLTNSPAATTQPSRHGTPRAPTLDHVWLAAALLLIALRPLLTPIPPNDFWWHLATGRVIASTGSVPVADSFSFTRAGQPFFNQGWLAQLFMYWLHQLGGVPLILVVQSLVIALAYGLLLRLCIRRTGRLRLSVGLLLMVTLPLSFTNWIVRPQSYALPIFAAFLTILTEYRLGYSRRLWLLPILMALWVNIHGTFVLGLALIGLTWVGMLFERGDDRQPTTDDTSATASRPPIAQLALWGAITATAMLLNPRGVGVLAYVRNLLGSNAVTTLVTEWAPPTTHDLEGTIFFLFVMLCGAVLIYARRRPALADMLLFGAFLWLALGANRNVIWFGMVATPLLISQAASLGAGRAPARTTAGSPLLNGLLIGVLALLLLLALPWVKPALDLPPAVGALIAEDTPVKAVEFLRAQPDRPRHLFHTEAYGSYLIWAAPEQLVFVDTRIELYPFEQWRDYINLGQGNNVAALLQKYDIDGLLLNAKQQAPLIAAIRADTSWAERYHDQQTLYFVRKPAR